MVDDGVAGAIVNIASVDGIHPSGNLAHYDASKGGLVMLTRSLAFELGKAGVRVNSICPGGIKTPGADAATASMIAASGISAEQVVSAFAARIPLGRMGEPDEVAAATLFLVSTAGTWWPDVFARNTEGARAYPYREARRRRPSGHPVRSSRTRTTYPCHRRFRDRPLRSADVLPVVRVVHVLNGSKPCHTGGEATRPESPARRPEPSDRPVEFRIAWLQPCFTGHLLDGSVLGHRHQSSSK
jgi:hypothetical protein